MYNTYTQQYDGVSVNNTPANAGDIRDAGSRPGKGRSPGEGNDNPLQDSCLENSMDWGAWWAIVQGVAKSQTRPKPLSRQACNAYFVVAVQSPSRVGLFVIPWTAAHQASLSFTNSRRLLKLMSIESMVPSNHLILCHPRLLLPSIFPSIRVFSNESVLHIGGQSIGASALASVLPMNIQD